MPVEFLFASAVVPSLLLIWFFHSRDVYPEPQRVVWATFGFGVLTTIGAVALELPIQMGFSQVTNPFAGGALEGFFCAGMVEEALKFSVVYFYCMRHREFDEPMDGIVYGAVASLGFATLENVLYVTQGGFGLAILRAASAVPGHACMGAIMGYFVGQAKFVPAKRASLLAKAYFIPFLLHGLYDSPLLTLSRASKDKVYEAQHQAALVGFALVTVLVLLGEITGTLLLVRRLRVQQQGWQAQGWAPQTMRDAQAAQVAAQQRAMQPWGQQAPQAWGGQQQLGQPFVPYRPAWAGQPARAGSGAGSVLMVIFGALLACGGGFMSLGTVLALASNKNPQEVGTFLLVGVILGLAPLAVGALLFGLGLRGMTRGQAAPAWNGQPLAAR